MDGVSITLHLHKIDRHLDAIDAAIKAMNEGIDKLLTAGPPLPEDQILTITLGPKSKTTCTCDADKRGYCSVCAPTAAKYDAASKERVPDVVTWGVPGKIPDSWKIAVPKSGGLD